MKAITFTEAGEDETTREISNKRARSEQRSASQTGKENGKRPKLQV
jgi:hypothetical protein